MMEATDQLLDKTILSLLRFEENGRRRAIIWRENAEEDKIYSYEQLSSESSKFAEKLCECDIPKNSFVAFTVGSLSYHCLPAVIIGILKHGCAFAPIADINNIVLKFCGNYVATHSASQVGFGNYIGECTVFGQTWHILKKCAVAPDVELDSQDYAYTLTTSGTTGIAKVVQVPHKAIVPNIIYLKERFGITSEDVILQCAPPTFDPFVVEMFMTFSAGATLLMIPPLEKSQPSLAFKAIIKSPTPTVIQATPSFICNFDTRSLLELLGPKSSLNVLAFGGEPCPMKSQLLQWKSADNRTRIFNLYGVTEVSCWSTCEELDFSNCEEIRLGDFLPFNQVQIRSINDDSELKSGVGQIFITTMDRMCTINGRSLRNQWHATGDLAKVWTDGKFSLVGRMSDHQNLKILGQKVNVYEIESKAKQLNLVKNCVVLTNVTSILKLALFVVPADNLKAVNKEVQHEVLTQLQRVLPALSIPNVVVTIKQLPLTSHGKVDQRILLLKAKRLFRKTKSTRLKYDSGLKRLVKEAWIVSLGTLVESEISPKSLFLSSGGDSVKAMHFHARLLMTAGIKSDEPLLLTCILEKSFREITECFALLLKNRSQKCNANGVASQNLRLGRKCDFSDIANQSQILCSVSRGQICFHQTNFSALAAEPAAMSKFCEFWKVDFGKCIDASPLAVQYLNGAAIVCIGSHSGKFACIDVHSGTELWSIFLGDRIEATASLSSFGTFFIGCYDGALYNVDRDGKVLWKFQTKGTIKSSAVTSMENIIFGSYDQSLYCVNQKSGDLVWEQQLHRGAIYANPVVHGNLVIVATLGGYVVCVDVEQGSEVWQLHQGKPFFSTPLQLDKKLVMVGNVSGLISCIDVSNGMIISSFQAESDLFSSFTFDGPQIFYADKMKVSQFDSRTGEKVNQFNVGGRITSTAMAFNNILVVASSTRVVLFNISNGSVAQDFLLPKEVFSSPALSKDYLIFGCRDSFLYCYKRK